MARGIWLDRSNILDNPTRRTLYNYILEHPGQVEAEIFRATGLGQGRARNYLKLLVRWEYIFRDREGGYRVSITSPAR